MTVTSPDIRSPAVITSHQNVDFDAFAASVGAAKLYPDASIVFSGSLNRNVREFASLHADELPIVAYKALDMSSIRTLIVVDTADCGRLAELGELCERPDVEVIVFDHHQSEAPTKPAFVRGDNWVVSGDGAQSTSMVYIILERGLPVSPLEATIFALGIHEDTGSLTYPRTTVRDAEMLAACMRLGASNALIERYLHNPLTSEQRDVLMRVLDAARIERVRGLDVHVVALRMGSYVDGLSVIAHKVMDLLNSEILLQAVEMEDRTFVTARSRAGSVDVAELLRAVGGGGHAQAASAVLRDRDPQEVVDQLLAVLSTTSANLPTAADIMSCPVRFIDADTPVDDALLAAQRFGHSGISVQEGDVLAGIVARRDLDKAVRHGLGHAPVKGVMTRNVVFARRSATVDELRRLMVDTNVGRLPIVSDEGYERATNEGVVHVDDVLGIATRTDVLGAYQGPWEEDRGGEAGAQRVDALLDLPYFGKLFRAACSLSVDFAGVYLVGGFVRDLLLGRPNYDVDIAVEGDGIEFARRLAQKFNGRLRPHHKFKTAVVMLPPGSLGPEPAWLPTRETSLHVDVATTRTEFYDYPAALPSVEHASVRQDLFRRDFTVNAMAVSLKGEDIGTVLDFFGGARDLQEGIIRVLHNLSFIEDPTRIFRAVRYENRYGFRMDEQTHSLAKACVEMHLVGDLSSARLRDELIALLDESEVDWTLGRLFELGVARQVHPKLATGVRTVGLIQRLDGLVGAFSLQGEVVRWRLRLAALTRNMSHDELFMWLERLRLRHSDAHVVRRSVVMGPRLEQQLSGPALDDWELFSLLDSLPVESAVFALGRTALPDAEESLSRYLGVLRRRRVTITGADVIALGVRQGPQVGRVLEVVRKERVEGRLRPGLQAELAAARAFIQADTARPAEVTG